MDISFGTSLDTFDFFQHSDAGGRGEGGVPVESNDKLGPAFSGHLHGEFREFGGFFSKHFYLYGTVRNDVLHTACHAFCSILAALGTTAVVENKN